MNKQEKQSQFHIVIGYEDSIRCIDLENLLTSIRKLCQYEFAERTGTNPRDFTDVMKIQCIEKGSIDISFLIDFLNIADAVITANDCINNNSINCHDIISIITGILQAYNLGKTLSPKKEQCIKTIVSTLSRLKNITIKNSEQEIKIKVDEDGDINISKQ